MFNPATFAFFLPKYGTIPVTSSFQSHSHFFEYLQLILSRTFLLPLGKIKCTIKPRITVRLNNLLLSFSHFTLLVLLLYPLAVSIYLFFPYFPFLSFLLLFAFSCHLSPFLCSHPESFILPPPLQLPLYAPLSLFLFLSRSLPFSLLHRNLSPQPNRPLSCSLNGDFIIHGARCFIRSIDTLASGRYHGGQVVRYHFVMTAVQSKFILR